VCQSCCKFRTLRGGVRFKSAKLVGPIHAQRFRLSGPVAQDKLSDESRKCLESSGRNSNGMGTLMPAPNDLKLPPGNCTPAARQQALEQLAQAEPNNAIGTKIEAWRYALACMERSGRATVSSSSANIELVGRAGFGWRLGFQLDRTDWKSVLRSCRIRHGDIVGRHVFRAAESALKASPSAAPHSCYSLSGVDSGMLNSWPPPEPVPPRSSRCGRALPSSVGVSASASSGPP